jgi:uncharacterized protein (TIGR03435 family)
MRNCALLAGVCLVLASARVITQTAGAPEAAGQDAPISPRPLSSPNGSGPEFEVATVKPSDPAKCCSRGWSSDGRRFALINMNLKYAIQWAWNLQAKQVAGGPLWIDDTRFDISGEIGGDGIPTYHEWKIAMQKLLTDRFQLQLHHEKREMPAFALAIAKGGPKLTPGDGNVKAHQGMGFVGPPGQTMHGNGVNASIADFVGELQRIVMDRPIVDETGLTGVYDIKIAFTREEPGDLGTTQLADTAAPNLLDALQQQLGLKLERKKTTVDVIVIDHAEPPSPN